MKVYLPECFRPPNKMRYKAGFFHPNNGRPYQCMVASYTNKKGAIARQILYIEWLPR